MNIFSVSPYNTQKSLYKNNYSRVSFCSSKPINVTKEQLVPLINQGLSLPEIGKRIGGVSKYICAKILKQYGLVTLSQTSRRAGANVLTDEFKKMVESGIPRSEVVEKLGITVGIYNRMYRELGVKSTKVKQKDFIDAIKKETFLELINSGKTVPEIRKALNNISRETYDALLKKFGIETVHKKRLNNAKQISKEQLIGLLEAGKTSEEVIKELKISHSTLMRCLSTYKLETVYSQNRKNSESITKELFLEIYNTSKNVNEIITKLGISKSTYKKLLSKFEIITKRKENNTRTNNITREQLQNLVDSDLSAKDIYTRLNISNKTFYNLLKLHKIDYNYQHHNKEIKIPMAKLVEVANSGKSINEITEELGVYASTYATKAKIAQINTKLRSSINKIESITKNEIENLINSKLNVNEICEKLNITNSIYCQLIEKYNINTKSKRIHEHISQVTKSQILELKSIGKKMKEICEELGISKTSYYKIMNS